MTKAMKLVDDVKGRVERVLIEHPVLGFPFSIFKKFGDDRAGQLAALVAYYGFLSLFPLLLVAVTVLGMLLRTNPELQGKVLDSALTSFPIIGDQLRENVRSISGGTLAIVIGIGGALWGGLGGIKAMQNAFDRRRRVLA
jgi:membrane protein